MANGAQPAAGGHWIADAPPNFRARVVERMLKNLPQFLLVNDPQGSVSRFEDKVFRESVNLEGYLRTISMKMMSVQQRCQPVVQPASDHQQQAHMGQQMRPLNTAPANSSAAAMRGTVRPPQVQFHPRHPVGTQIQTQRPATHNSTEQPQPQLAMVNHQDSRVNQHQGYYTHGGGTVPNVATMQIRHPEVQNNRHPEVQDNQQLGHPAGEVDWREDAFQKITSLKDAHLSELMEFQRALQARGPQRKTNQQLEALPREQADQYRKTVHIMDMVAHVLSFLQTQRSDMSQLSREQFHKCQTNLYALLRFYRQRRAQSVRRPSAQNCHELPRANGATDNNSQQNHQVQPAAEAFSPQSSQNVPAISPLAQQQDHGDHFAAEAENGEVGCEAEAPVAVDLTAVTGDTEPFPGGTCNQEIPQEHPTDEAIPQLTHDVVDPAQTPPAQQETHSTAVRVEGEDDSVPAKAETPVAVEVTRTSSSPAALRSLASDMGLNMKRAFSHTIMDGSSCDDEPSGESCYKRPKTHGGSLSLPDEIRAVQSMLVKTEISISKDDTGGADGKVIKLCYNAVSLAPGVREAIGASEISTKLLVPADYPRSSPVIFGGHGEQRMGVDVSFRRALVLLPEPRSIEEMATAWDNVVRRAVGLFANRLSGGTFSTRYGCLESFIQV